MPEVIVIAGPNGAGKTTFARQLLGMRQYPIPYLNADEIARESEEFAHPLAAGRQFVHRMRYYAERRRSFAVETTLASPVWVDRFARWREAGYITTLHFIELPSEQYAIERVQRRVRDGGHPVPGADIRRRFHRGRKVFQSLGELPDRWFHWRSDEKGLRLVEYATQ